MEKKMCRLFFLKYILSNLYLCYDSLQLVFKGILLSSCFFFLHMKGKWCRMKWLKD